METNAQNYFTEKKNSRKISIIKGGKTIPRNFKLTEEMHSSCDSNLPETEYDQGKETSVQKQFIRVLGRLNSEPRTLQ